jgi:prepilin-type N-terminal cleavage/methylation domain-containing protein
MKSTRHLPLASRRNRRGYTVVEVMSAMTLFAIGAAGVISMQRVTIQGGDDARHFDVATNIAHEWEHRLQRDAANWTQPDSLTPASNRTTNTLWLFPINEPAAAWSVPAAGPGGALAGYSSAFDLLGKDIDPASPDHVFCVQYRLGWIANEAGSSGNGTPTAIIRAEIRVFWSRLEYDPTNCSDVTVYETAASRQKNHFVFVTTAVRANPTQ